MSFLSLRVLYVPVHLRVVGRRIHGGTVHSRVSTVAAQEAVHEGVREEGHRIRVPSIGRRLHLQAVHQVRLRVVFIDYCEQKSPKISFNRAYIFIDYCQHIIAHSYKNKNIRMYHPWSSLTNGGL